MPRRRQYLYLYESLAISVLESQLGSGKTLTAKFCATSPGNPAAIGTLTATATASGGTYAITFPMSDLVSQLGTAYIDEPVFLRLSDGTAWTDVYEFVATDIDPDLQPQLL